MSRLHNSHWGTVNFTGGKYTMKKFAQGWRNKYLKYPSAAHGENWLHMDWITEIQKKNHLTCLTLEYVAMYKSTEEIEVRTWKTCIDEMLQRVYLLKRVHLRVCLCRAWGHLGMVFTSLGKNWRVTMTNKVQNSKVHYSKMRWSSRDSRTDWSHHIHAFEK